MKQESLFDHNRNTAPLVSQLSKRIIVLFCLFLSIDCPCRGTWFLCIHRTKSQVQLIIIAQRNTILVIRVTLRMIHRLIQILLSQVRTEQLVQQLADSKVMRSAARLTAMLYLRGRTAIMDPNRGLLSRLIKEVKEEKKGR